MGNRCGRNLRAVLNGCWLTLATLLVSLAVPAVFPQQAWAHATLLNSSPAPYVRLEHPPAQIQLVFNERIESVFHSLRIVDSHGNEMETQAAHTADGGETLVVNVADLPPGGYGVYWRINSLDGHQVQGQFGFGVGGDAPSEAEVIAWKPAAGREMPSWFFPLIKGLSLLALSVWLGGFSVHLLAGGAEKNDIDPAINEAFMKKTSRISIIGGVAYLLLETLALTGKTAAFTGSSFLAALNLEYLKATLTGSSYGEWWSIRITAGVLLLLSVVFRPVKKGIVFVFGSAALVWSIAVTGHAQAATNHFLLAAFMDGLHLAASLVWVGGLFYLGIGVGTALDSIQDSSDAADESAVQWLGWIAPRFSRLAQICVLLLFGTGIYNSWLHIPALAAFTTTDYGRALLGKLFWVFATLSVAFINWRKVLPELSRIRAGAIEKLRWVPRFQWLMQAEFAGCVIVFATVAMLTNMPPASADPNAGPRELRAKSGAHEILLRVEPGTLGANKLRVTLVDGSGKPQTAARKVTIYLRSLDMDMGLATGEAIAQPDGSYAAEMTFSMKGRWRVSVEVSPARGDGFVVEYDVTIS